MASWQPTCPRLSARRIPDVVCLARRDTVRAIAVPVVTGIAPGEQRQLERRATAYATTDVPTPEPSHRQHVNVSAVRLSGGHRPRGSARHRLRRDPRAPCAHAGRASAAPGRRGRGVVADPPACRSDHACRYLTHARSVGSATSTASNMWSSAGSRRPETCADRPGSFADVHRRLRDSLSGRRGRESKSPTRPR